LAAEGWTHDGEAIPIALASMWPRPVGRGRSGFATRPAVGLCRFNVAAACWPRKVCRPVQALPRGQASMWPRPVGRGRYLRRAHERGVTAASMWPRPVGRGRGWHGHLTRGIWSASMWPRPVGRGRASNHGRLTGRSLASMWPRPVGRGRGLAGNCRRLPRSCFNVAAACWPRKVKIVDWGFCDGSGLQCGRGLLAAEGARAWRRPLEPCHASMWPRPVGRGRVAPSAQQRGHIDGFNVAAACWPRKATSTASGRSCWTSFNVAAACWPRKAAT